MDANIQINPMTPESINGSDNSSSYISENTVDKKTGNNHKVIVFVLISVIFLAIFSIILIAIMKHSANNNIIINYDAGLGIGGAPQSQTVDLDKDSSITLPEIGQMEKIDNRFTGWRIKNEATEANWEAGERIDISEILDYIDENRTVTIYAVWEYITPFPDSLTTMQGMTEEICNAAGIDASKTLVDIRDNRTYIIRKLKDGKCWMAQNLSTMDMIISSEDSNLPSGTNFSLPASTTGWADVEEDSGDVAESEIKEARLHYDYTYGAVYNYYTATAGATWLGDDKSNNTTITQDICPKGWRLPTGGAVDASTGNGEFQALYDSYNTKYLMRTDPSGPQFLFAGNYFLGERLDMGDSGSYWSSTIYSSRGAYYLHLNKSGVFPQSTDNKYPGNSVRCVAK